MEPNEKPRQRKNIVHEIVYGPHASLRAAYDNCTKHPGHNDYTSVKNFTVDSIPKAFRNFDVYEMCKCLIELTCSLIVTQISDSRTQDEAKTKADSRAQTVGSGSVFIPKDFVRDSGAPCPCRYCAASPSPSNVWSLVYVTTAYHVVWDDYEAEHCEIRLNFDDEEMGEEDVIRLTGYKIVNHDQIADRTIVSCITHDLSIVQKIQEVRSKAKTLEEKFRAASVSLSQRSRLVVIVSHPHGQAKMISFGSVVSMSVVKAHSDRTAWTEYTYDAPTCPASSGALVWIYGQLRVGYRDSDITSHTHSGVYEDRNISGYGLDFID